MGVDQNWDSSGPHPKFSCKSNSDPLMGLSHPSCLSHKVVGGTQRAGLVAGSGSRGEVLRVVV